MPKVGFSAEQQVISSLNFGEGWGEVVEASAKVHQFPPAKKGDRAGIQSEPQTVVRLMIHRTDADGKKSTDDPVEELFGCGSLEHFHPGVIDGPEDQEPEDKGTALETEGNCIWFDGSSKGMNSKSKWAVFTGDQKIGNEQVGLTAKAFKPSVLAAGYLPDMVGLRAYFKTVDVPSNSGGYKCLVADKITRFPYEAKSSTKKTEVAKGGAAPGSAPVNGKASAAATAAAQSADDDGTIDAISTQILVAMATKLAGTALPKAKIPSKLITFLGAGVGQGPIPPKQHKPIQDKFKNVEWLTEKCGEMDYTFAEEIITFPAAE